MIVEKLLTIYCDGGARGNPGPGAIGVAVYQNGTKIKELGKFIGLKITNNQAEYCGVIESLEIARELGASEVAIKLDSELVERQLSNKYKVKNNQLKTLWNKANQLAGNFRKVSYEHIPRSNNKEADRLVNQVLNNKI